MMNSKILKLTLILMLFLFDSCNSKKPLHFDDKPEISNDIKSIENRSLKRKKITEGFQNFGLPGSSSSIQLLRLGQASDGSYWSVVKFPKDYHRPDSVFLGVEEGYLMIEGELKYSNISSPKGSYTVIPAEAARIETQTDGVAIAIARFSGKPFWLDQPKQKQTKEIEVNFFDTKRDNDRLFDKDKNRMTYGNVDVAYMEEIPQLINYQGGVIYSLTDSVIVEILEGAPFPDLKKPFFVWTNQSQ